MEKNKSRVVPLVVAALVAVLAVAGFAFGKRYYDNHYVASNTMYAMVPVDFDVTPQPLYDFNGKPVDINGTSYKLTAYNEQGESQVVEFTVQEGRGLYQPGSFLTVKLSNDGTVLGQSPIEEAEVPSAVRLLLG